MSTPEVVEETDDEPGPDVEDEDVEEPESEEESEPEAEPTPEPKGEPDVEEVDLTDDDLDGGGDLFTGTDDATGSSDGDVEESESDEDEEDGGDVLDGLDERGEAAENAINEGMARLAVVGLEDDEREDLLDEFEEVFKAFRLGYFGSRFLEEYVFAPEDDEVDPTWGLVGAMLCCVAFTVWMRPDGDELVGDAKEAIGNIAGGVA